METRELKHLVFGKRNKLTVKLYSGITNDIIDVLKYFYRNKHKEHITRRILDVGNMVDIDKALMEYNTNMISPLSPYYTSTVVMPVKITEPITQELCCLMLNHIIKHDTSMRVEGNTIGLYSNNNTELSKLGKLLSVIDTRMTEEVIIEGVYSKKSSIDVTYHMLPDGIEEGTIQMSSRLAGYSHRIKLGSFISPEFAQWLLNNESNLRYGPVLKKDLQRKFFYMGGKYFYINSDRMLTLLKMSFSTQITRVDKILIK